MYWTGMHEKRKPWHDPHLPVIVRFPRLHNSPVPQLTRWHTWLYFSFISTFITLLRLLLCPESLPLIQMRKEVEVWTGSSDCSGVFKNTQTSTQSVTCAGFPTEWRHWRSNILLFLFLLKGHLITLQEIGWERGWWRAAKAHRSDSNPGSL